MHPLDHLLGRGTVLVGTRGALRLYEVGMIQSSPNALLAEGTDWRFLNELKRELKA